MTTQQLKQYTVSKTIAKLLSLTEGAIITFATHRELDEFITKILDEQCLFLENKSEDFKKLKELDLIFWSEFEKDKTNPQKQPLGYFLRVNECNEDFKCPLQNPLTIISFKINK